MHSKQKLSNTILSDVIHFMKYAKYLPELRRRETFIESMKRNRDSLKKKFPFLASYIDKVYDRSVFTKKVLPSMRFTQFAGPALDANNVRMFNCSYLPADHPKAFSETMYLLLSGSGVGYSIQSHHIAALPTVKQPVGEKTFVIPDDIAGWADSINELVNSYFYGTERVKFDFSGVREKGSRLITSGGKAPGPEPLKRTLAKITEIFERVLKFQQNTQLSSIQVHSIMCHIANAVLAGGIRRSSCIALFSFDDLDMRTCKHGEWWIEHEEFGRANNSAVADYNEVSQEQFEDFYKDVVKSKAGEPGIYWVNDKNVGVNPCKPLHSTILTPSGYITFKEALELDELTVVLPSGLTAKASKPYKTGENRVVQEFTLSNGAKLYGTGNHQHKNEFGEWQEMDSMELGDKVWVHDSKETSSHLLASLEIVVAINREFSVEDVYDITVYDDSHAFIDSGVVTHNCGEASLRDHSFCVAGDTKLITKDGVCTIKEAVGKEIEIWNGKAWSTVSPFQTGTNDTLHRISFSDGSYLDATNNHKFLVKTRFEKEYKEIETLDLINLLKTTKYGLQIPRANIDLQQDDEKDEVDAYTYGFALGDASVTKGGKVIVSVFTKANKLICLPFLNATQAGRVPVYYNNLGSEYQTFYLNIPSKFVRVLKYSQGLPEKIFTWSKKSILDFIAGWADADGSNASEGIRIYGDKYKLRDAQLLLTKCGFNSSLNLAVASTKPSNFGKRLKDVWYLQITLTQGIPCKRLTCDNTVGATRKGMFQIVKSISTLDGEHESFCLTEDTLHQCVFNNVLTKQCNLVEMNAQAIKGQQDFVDTCRDAAFINTLQASYTDFKYLRPIWKQNTEEDALIGTGITGIAGGALDNLNLEEGSLAVLEENARVAALIGINPAARCCLVKPSGTTSLVLSTSSGIHDWHDRYYIRRAQVNKKEAIYGYLVKAFPALVEDLLTDPENTAVLSFPQKAPDEAAIAPNTTALDVLERCKRFNMEWIRPSHRRGANYHNVSATVYVEDEEMDTVRDWLWENRFTYHGLTVFPVNNHTYKQTPFESCSKETYEKMLESFVGVDLTQVLEEDDLTNLNDQAACFGGVCALI